MSDKRAFTLQPLVASGVFEAGLAKLSCTVGGTEYYADLGDNGEIQFEGRIFKSPSAFSVYVKRKINPGRKADDGWTSVKYQGDTLSTFRQQLEQLLASGEAVGISISGGSGSPLLGSVVRQRRKARPKNANDWSVSDASENEHEHDESFSFGVGTSEGDLKADPLILPEPTMSNTARLKEHDINPEYTWVQCEDPKCHKWRRARITDLPDGEWFCSYNKDTRFNSCDVPQEYSEEEIDRILEEQSMARHVANSKRPPLDVCTPEEFETDLVDFLMNTRSEYQLALLIREHRITCNNTPLDCFSLYREVINRGGLMNNERYDERRRWVGRINFAGEIFPQMKNWTANNRATSVGNQLLNNYKKFLLAYERAWAPVDLAQVTKPRSSTPPPAATEIKPQRPLSASRIPSDALTFLADVAGASDAVAARSSSTPAPPKPAKRPSDTGTAAGPAGERKRRRTDDGAGRVEGASRRVAELQESWQDAEAHPGSIGFGPGQILLAQDPRDLSRHWAVVAADVAELPMAVATGGVLAAGSNGFPLRLVDISSSVRLSQACPVLVVGTPWLGWVERSSCRPYSLTAGQSAMASAWAAIARGSGSSAAPLLESEQPLLACVRGLKVAAEYCSTNYTSHSGPTSDAARSWVQARSVEHTAARLLELEGQIPAELMCNQSFYFWHSWRSTVHAATSPGQLASQVLMLAYQLNSEVLRRGSSDIMWDELQELLGIPSQGAAGALEGRASGGGSAPGVLSDAPSCLSVDEAVAVLYEALDWARVRRVWNSLSQVGFKRAVAEESKPSKRSTSSRAAAKEARAPEPVVDLPLPPRVPRRSRTQLPSADDLSLSPAKAGARSPQLEPPASARIISLNTGPRGGRSRPGTSPTPGVKDEPVDVPLTLGTAPTLAMGLGVGPAPGAGPRLSPSRGRPGPERFARLMSYVAGDAGECDGGSGGSGGGGARSVSGSGGDAERGSGVEADRSGEGEVEGEVVGRVPSNQENESPPSSAADAAGNNVYYLKDEHASPVMLGGREGQATPLDLLHAAAHLESALLTSKS